MADALTSRVGFPPDKINDTHLYLLVGLAAFARWMTLTKSSMVWTSRTSAAVMLMSPKLYVLD